MLAFRNIHRVLHFITRVKAHSLVTTFLSKSLQNRRRCLQLVSNPLKSARAVPSEDLPWQKTSGANAHTQKPDYNYDLRISPDCGGSCSNRFEFSTDVCGGGKQNTVQRLEWGLASFARQEKAVIFKNWLLRMKAQGLMVALSQKKVIIFTQFWVSNYSPSSGFSVR